MAVYDVYLTFAPPHEAAIGEAVVAREDTVEEAVGDGQLPTADIHRHEAAVGGIAADAAVDGDRRAAVLNHDIAIGLGSNAADELLVAADGASRAQVAEGGILYKLEWCFILVACADVHGQRVAVAVEGAAVGIAVIAATGGGRDVGHEHGIDIILALGRNHLFAEGVPVGCRRDAHGIGQVPRAQRRGAGVDIHADVILHAGARQVDDLLAGVALVLRQFVGLGVNQFAGVVTHGDHHHHLSAAVPHGVRFVAIFPVDADRIGPLVGERGGVVLQAQQV